MAIVRVSFRPEFLNRVDEIILFHRLQKSEMTRIVDIQMKRLARLLEERKITIGCRVYVGRDEIKRVQGGLGISILTTRRA